MCIAILNTKISTLKKDTLKNCWLNNGDGAGILYIDNNQSMQVFKEMTDFDKFYEEYLHIKKNYGKRNIVLHFRISTHGKVNATNCHPFLVDEGLGFVHNGMIHTVPVSKEYSDTYMFNECILKKFKPGFEYDQDILDLLAEYIGTGSKLIFLNKDNDYAIVNEKAGHWSDGCWFSNSSYKQVNNWVDYGGVKKYKGSSYNSYFNDTNWNTIDVKETKTSKSYNDFYDDDDFQDSISQCKCCGWGMTGEESDEALELNICEFCAQDMINDGWTYNQEGDPVSVCDCCNYNVGKFDENWNGYVCLKCSDDLSA